MEHIVYILITVVCFLGCCYYGTKLVDWHSKYRYERFTNNSAEFIADLYRIKMKWVRRGEFMYCKALDSVIGAETEQYEGQSENPETEYGKDYLERMKKVIDEEARKRSDILS